MANFSWFVFPIINFLKYVCVYMWVFMCVQACVCADMYVCAGMCVCRHVCADICVYRHMCDVCIRVGLWACVCGEQKLT